MGCLGLPKLLLATEWSSTCTCQQRMKTMEDDPHLGVFQRPLTLILLRKYRDTNERRIVIQIGGVYTTFCQEEGIFLQKYRDRNERCIAILFKSIGVRGRCDSPDSYQAHLHKGIPVQGSVHSGFQTVVSLPESQG